MMWLGPPPRAIRTLLIANDAGLGHLVRCMALSRYLDKPALLVPKAHPILKTAPCPVGTWDDPPDADLCIVDTYVDRAGWINRMRPKARQIGVIADDSYHNFQADYLINGNVGAENLSYHIPGTVLAGSRYALLRPVFGARHTLIKRGKVNRLLVCLGSGPMPDEVPEAVRAAGVPEVLIYGGPLDPLPQFGPHKRVGNGYFGKGVDAMAGADLAITPASGTALELLCMGVPCLTYVTADNQVTPEHAMMAAGVAHPLSTKNLIDLIADPTERGDMSERGMELVDGKGCERVGLAIR